MLGSVNEDMLEDVVVFMAATCRFLTHWLMMSLTVLILLM